MQRLAADLLRGARAARGAVGAGRRRLDRGSARRAPAVSVVLRPPARHVEPAPSCGGAAAGRSPRPAVPPQCAARTGGVPPPDSVSACRWSSRSTAAPRSARRSGSRGRAPRGRDARRPARRSASSSPRWATRPTSCSSSQRPSRRPATRASSTCCSPRASSISIALLSMAILDLGRDAVSFTGAQAGIVTDTDARQGADRRRALRPRPDAIDAGRIAIVAGFQGVTADAETTTLGRGGSDTTAVALAAALEGRRLRDLHRRRGRLHRRPADRRPTRASSPPSRTRRCSSCPRRARRC